MDCPRCALLLETRGADGVEIDLCSRCDGMFLDAGELNRIAEKTSGDLEFSTVHEDDFVHEDAFPPIDCPHCVAGTMRKVEFNIHTGIILDHCQGCGGFWLDGKELERINAEVRRLNEADEGGPEPPMLWFARFIWTLPR